MMINVGPGASEDQFTNREYKQKKLEDDSVCPLSGREEHYTTFFYFVKLYLQMTATDVNTTCYFDN